MPSLARKLVGAAGLVAAGNILSRLLGLVRDPVMAQFFGRDLVTDTFVAAQTLSTVFFDLLVSGLVGAALIPTLSRLAAREDREEFWLVATSILSLALVILSAVVALLLLAAPWLVLAMSGGYDAAALRRETLLARLMMPTILLMGLSAVGTAILYSLQRYRVSALAVACINAGMILGMLLLHRLGIVSAAVGLLTGAVAQLLFQGFALRTARMPWRFRPDWRHPEVRRIGQLYLPVAASFVISSVVTGADRHLYSLGSPGGLSAANYATRLLQVPLGLVSTAIAMAILPTISRYAEEADWPAYRRTVAAGLKVGVLLTLPIMVALGVLALPALALIFRHGQFSQADVAATAKAFWLYAPQLPFVAADQLLINAFYARHDTRTPTAVSFFTALVWAAIAVPGLVAFDWPALVVANTVQNSVHAVIMYVLLRRRERAIGQQGIGRGWSRGVAAACLMAGACWAVAAGLEHALGSGKVADLVVLVAAGAAGGAVYCLCLLVWSRGDAGIVLRSMRR